ncbi:ferritin-like domain-containing protein [Sporolactobacillus sp. Y61]|uniref:Ferritin-like domain-containing protein n=1 Tax=Sporolactobacillus sp. Y61 TaxID=3160863 RepID=A0AAU8IDR6_9BACL
MSAESDEQSPDRLRSAITGEWNAMACYEILMNQTMNERERQQIAEIRRDEMHHFQVFSSLYSQLTGETFRPQLTPNLSEYVS